MKIGRIFYVEFSIPNSEPEGKVNKVIGQPTGRAASSFHRPAQAVILDRRRNHYDFKQDY